MPELPEVEVCRLGITPHIIEQQVGQVIVRQRQMRWPIPEEVDQLTGETIHQVSRRSKYLLIKLDSGTLVLHLGMSGTIRVIEKNTPVAKHDHFDLVLSNGKSLRLNDPRRFGAVLFFPEHVDQAGLLAKLGPEPLTDEFNTEHLIAKASKRKVPIKTFLMNNAVVVGVGNIYANEALFQAGILPTTLACNITDKQFAQLADIIKQVLAAAIEQGGTTLKDFTQADGRPGYFAQKLKVYGRAGKACPVCKTTLEEVRQSNRSSVFCPTCQH